MKLPTEKKDRDAVYRNLVRQCDVSRQDRHTRYQKFRTLLLTGTPDGAKARYNAIKAHVLQSSAYLYAPESVRFGVAYPPHYGDRFEEEADAARQELHRLWHDTNASLIFDMGVTWAHAYDSVVWKILMSDNEPTLGFVADPSDLGVLNEQITEWGEQEAICHWYTVDLARFRRRVLAMERDDKRRARILEMAETYAVPGQETSTYDVLPPAVQGVILAGASPNIQGGYVNRSLDGPLAIPRVQDELVKLAELWIRDDDLGDYRVVTNFTATEDILWEPPNPLTPGRHPFYGLTLGMPVPGYLWGVCPMQDLQSLQEWHEKKVSQLDQRDDLQLDPPISFIGVGGVDGERAKLLRQPGGDFPIANPNVKIEKHSPPPLPDPFGWLDRIDQMFRQQAGLPRGMTGQTEQGVRSGEQAMAQAILGGGPTLKQAMIVEDAAEDVATALLKLDRRVNTRSFVKATGGEFLLSQMPGDFTARVWAHSASPLYQQHILQKAMLAKQAGAIDNEDFLLLLDLPMSDVRLISKARKLAEAQAQQRERLVRAKEQEAQAKIQKAQR